MQKLNKQAVLTEWEGVDLKLLPSFVVIGAMKAGTTSLYEYLNEHPDIYMTKMKEPGLFLNYTKLKKKLQKYINIESRQHALEYLMQNYQSEQQIGEASTYYTRIPIQGVGTPEHIKYLRPNMKFIYVLRNPIDRIVSHYLHKCRRDSHAEQIKAMGVNQVVLKNASLLQTSLYFYRLTLIINVKHWTKNIMLDMTSPK